MSATRMYQLADLLEANEAALEHLQRESDRFAFEQNIALRRAEGFQFDLDKARVELGRLQLERNSFKQRYETVKGVHESGLECVYAALGVSHAGTKAYEHALQAIKGLQERVKFTEAFETAKYQADEARADVTRLRLERDNHFRQVQELCGIRLHLDNELERVRQLYHELLFAVAKKYPGESRHQTALRYIRQAEESHGEAVSSTRLDT